MRLALAHFVDGLRLRIAALRVRSALARGFWLCMVLAHLPACLATLRAAGAGEFDALRWFLLVGSQVLFLLKIADVRWLRLPRRGRALLAVLVAGVLLHGDVVRRWVTTDSAPSVPSSAVVLAGGVLLLGTGEALTRRVARLVRVRRAAAANRARLTQMFDRCACLPRSHPATVLLKTVRVGRAPPA